MNSFIIVPYYNVIPKTMASYFTIIDSTLVVSTNDMFSNESKFLSTSINQLMYIFNGPNMGSFTINSLKSSTNKSYTLSITLNSIPPDLNDKTLCVISKEPTVYSIDRTFTKNISDDDNNNFTLLNKNTILINKFSSSSDDTLFLYILLTNKSFNITSESTQGTYTVTNVALSNNQQNKSYISLFGDIPIMPLVNKNRYEISIGTEKSTTISNVTINNTTVLPIESKMIHLSQTKYAYTPAHTPTFTPGFKPAVYTPVIMPHNPVDHSNNINIMNNNLENTIPYNDNVLLTYQTGKFYSNGFFSLNKVDPDLVDLFTSKQQKTVEHLKSFSFNDMEYIEKKSKDKSESNDAESTSEIIKIAKVGFKELRKLFNDTVKTTKAEGEKLIQSQIKPDDITNIPTLSGFKSTLSLSSIDAFKKQVNFIKQNSLLFLSNGLNTRIISTSTIPIHIKNGSDTIIDCNVTINKNILDTDNNKTFLLSTQPILPYVTFEYKTTHIVSNVISAGAFTILSISSSTLPTIILSNTDTLFSNDVTSFNHLLYTIIQDPTQQLSPPYLNILNPMDYSLIATLAILHVIPDSKQTTFTYSVVSVSENLNTLINNNDYLFSLLSTTDFNGTEGIIYRTEQLKPSLIKNNNLIQSAKLAIMKSLSNKINNVDLLTAKSIITETALQSSSIANMPTSPFFLEINNSLMTNTYNAIQFSLKADPTNPDFLLLKDKISNDISPSIMMAALNNASGHIKSSKNKYPDDTSISDLDYHLDQAFSSINSPGSSSDSINTLISQLDIALKKHPLDESLIKAKNLLSTTVSKIPISEQIEKFTSKPLIENLENTKVNGDNGYYFILLIVILLFLLFIIFSYKKKA